MKSAPFSITPVLLVMLLVSAILGALVASLSAGSGISGWLGFFLAAFLPVPLVGIVRKAMAALLGSTQGFLGPVPVAGPLPFRLGVGAATAAILAFGASNLENLFPFGPLSGALIAVITSIVLTVVFSTILATRK